MGGRAAPHFDLETALAAQGHAPVCGVDEVGRGPLAGPVVAAAVVLDPNNIPDGLNDSKRLTAGQREALSEAIHATAHVSIAAASVPEIDTHNILRATHIAMVRAVEGLALRPRFALIDGNLIPQGFPLDARAVVKGDTISLSIAAASIVAKVRRDAIMADLARQFPGYGWDTNMGYPTKAHKTALRALGVTPHHRRSFKPVYKIL